MLLVDINMNRTVCFRKHLLMIQGPIEGHLKRIVNIIRKSTFVQNEIKKITSEEIMIIVANHSRDGHWG